MQRSGLYIHVPFCATKCPYCDFYSSRDRSLIPGWLEGLEREMRLYSGFQPAFDTIYFGGGTPSLLSGPQLTRTMKSLRSCFAGTPDAEVTLEANPDDIQESKLKGLRELGFNRISLGVQSFNDSELVFLKRRHDADEAVRAIKQVRAAGFKNLSLDLMYGLPGQSLQSWTATLEKALSFYPEHLSCYQFTIESGTPFGVLKEKGALGGCPESEEEMFFLTSSRYLTEQGYLHYEISNFARGEDNRCRHNLKYWRRLPYLGLGPSAHSFQGNERWWNVRSTKKYILALQEGRSPVGGREWLTPDQIRMEKLFLGFRTSEGIGLAEIGSLPRSVDVLDEFQKHGLVRVANGRAVPTRQGFLVADRLPQQLC